MRMQSRRELLKPHGQAIGAFVRVVDLAILGAMGCIAYSIRFGNLELPAPYIATVFGGLLLAGLLMPLGGLYESWRGARALRIASHAILGWGITVSVLLIFLWASHLADYFSRLWLGYWIILGAIGVASVRVLAYGALGWARKRGFNTRKVLLFGAGTLGKRVSTAIDSREWTGFQIVCIVDDDLEKAGTVIGPLVVRTDTDNLPQLVDELDIDEVWLALPLKAEDRVRELLHSLRHKTVNIRLMPDVFGLRLVNHSVTDIAGIGTLNLTDTPLYGWNRFLKALEDRILGTVLFVTLLPVLACVVVAIWISMGRPILFRQIRHGWDGRPIAVYKFRSMSESACVGDVRQASRSDDRVTPLGRFLRRTSLDELPQILNVLNGTMSLVGPRPHALEHNKYYMDYIDDYMKRHCVKPGITGWAQINGLRGETETVEKMRRRVEFDLFYIENWSLAFDLAILARTVSAVASRTNAY